MLGADLELKPSSCEPECLENCFFVCVFLVELAYDMFLLLKLVLIFICFPPESLPLVTMCE